MNEYTFYYESFITDTNATNVVQDTAAQSAENPKVKRPLNAFMLYLDEKRKEMKDSNLHATKKTKLIGNMWNKEEKDIKSRYYWKAGRETVAHREKNPDHKYSPKTKKKRLLEAESSSKENEEFSSSKENKESSSSKKKQESSREFNTEQNMLSESHKEQFDISGQCGSFSAGTAPSSVLEDIRIYIDGSQLDSISLSLVRSIDFIVITDE